MAEGQRDNIVHFRGFVDGDPPGVQWTNIPGGHNDRVFVRRTPIGDPVTAAYIRDNIRFKDTIRITCEINSDRSVGAVIACEKVEPPG